MLGPAWVFDNSPIPDQMGYGQRAVDFLHWLRHPKSRKPGNASQWDSWQERIVRRIYGPCREDGRRQVRVVYLQVGRGNRKTSLGGALALLHTFGPERIPGGQALSAAADRKQSRIAFEEAISIIRATPQLKNAARVQDFKNRIVHPKSQAVYEAISADAATNYGRTPNFALVDELWAHKKIDLWHAIRTGLVKVEGSLLVIATTAGRGTNTPDYPIYDYARQVQSGAIDDPSFLSIIFEAPKGSDWTDESLWHAVNPGLQHGYPDIEGLRQLAHEARMRPADREAFQQYHLGIRQEHSVSPFVDMDVYDEGAAPVDLDALRERPCWLAVDVGLTTDLTAVVAAWRDDDDGYIVWPWFFCPEDNLQARADRDGVPYPRWAEEGFIIPTQGNVTDYRVVENHKQLGIDAEDAALKMRGAQLAQELMTPGEQQFEKYEQLNTLMRRNAITAELYQKAMTQMWLTAGESIASSFDSITQSMGKMGKENAKMLKASQTFGAAMALVSTMVGQAKALELPFPMNLAAAAVIAAKGFALVAAIKSSPTPSFAQGGFVSGPGSATSDGISARLSNGEYVVNAGATKQWGALLDAINFGMPRMPNLAALAGDGGFRMPGPRGFERPSMASMLPVDLDGDVLGRRGFDGRAAEPQVIELRGFNSTPETWPRERARAVLEALNDLLADGYRIKLT